MFTNKLKYDSIATAVKGVVETSEKELDEALKGNQHLIDKNKNNKVDPEDFKILRGEKKAVKKEEVETVDEVAPPGFEGTVKAMKKHKDIDNPFALAWSMKNKGYQSHKNSDGTQKEEKELTLRGFRRVLDEKLNTKKKTVDTLEGTKKVAGEHDNEHTSAKVELNSEEEKKPNAFDWKSFTKRGPQPNGGAGKKQGTRYGGSKQKEEPEEDEKKK